jgi:hypothetical protein
MFDEATARLIRGVPELSGLDSDRLPEFLTRIYTDFVKLRLNHQLTRTTASEVTEPLRRLTLALQLLAVRLDDNQQATAAAFVAGTGHQLLHRMLPDEEMATSLSKREVPSALAGAILFSIAGYASDATSLAALIATETDSEAARLQVAIAHVLSGNLAAVDSMSGGGTESDDIEERATDALWRELLRGVRELAVFLQTGNEEARETARRAFLSVRERSVAALPLKELAVKVVHLGFTGPHHLAGLLLKLTDRLTDSAASTLQPPDGVDPETWSAWATHIATTRPYLWPSHQNAIDAGYLNKGMSAVVTFPTGTGKSVIAELKVASTLACDRKVVVIAPTRALVSQTRDTLRDSLLAGTTVAGGLIGEGYSTDDEPTKLPEVAVMTPEQCLMLLTSEPLAFADVGLLIFDECHILHPSQGIESRRSVDSMLCLLMFMRAAPDADLLLISAMIENAKELAEWLTDALGRMCVPLTLDWRPTRQVRGIVMFDRADVEEMTKAVQKAKRERKTKHPGQRLKREVAARPYCLFGLNRQWSGSRKDDYALVELMPEEVPLNVNDRWQLAVNKNDVAAHAANHLRRSGFKTLVFVQNKTYCGSIAKRIVALSGESALQLTIEEELFRLSAADDIGDEALVLGPIGGLAAPHHSLLLAAERRLNESVFRRTDGIGVLVATPTLAQGMNLPADAVILVGDQRFDENEGGITQLHAHEMLNAAGRAGRAGYASYGVTIAVPNELIWADMSTNTLDPGWKRLRDEVFGKNDQCLIVDDPIEVMLDAIESHYGDLPVTLQYFLGRLPVSELADDDPTESLMERSLSAFRARNRGRSENFYDRVQNLIQRRDSVSDTPAEPSWVERVASSTGAPAQHVRDLDKALTDDFPEAPKVTVLFDWLAEWLRERPERIMAWLTNDTLTMLRFDTPSVAFVDEVMELARKWMAGRTLVDIEKLIAGNDKKPKTCDKARTFARTTMLHLSYAAGVVAAVRREQLLRAGTNERLHPSISLLAACIREGFDNVEKLALRAVSEEWTSRVRCHRLFDEIRSSLSGEPMSFAKLKEAVRTAASATESACFVRGTF